MNIDSQHNFEHILSYKVKYGYYQIIRLIMVSCALFMDVASLYFVFLSIPIIKKERELSSSEISPLGAAFYFGSFFGFIIHGIIADILGRR
jgi:hypothetical protein